MMPCHEECGEARPSPSDSQRPSRPTFAPITCQHTPSQREQDDCTALTKRPTVECSDHDVMAPDHETVRAPAGGAWDPDGVNGAKAITPARTPKRQPRPRSRSP
jgi:hypothetical protein